MKHGQLRLIHGQIDLIQGKLCEIQGKTMIYKVQKQIHQIETDTPEKGLDNKLQEHREFVLEYGEGFL
jgi:hypothetical protein